MHIPPKALAQPRTFATSKQGPTEAGQPLYFGMFPNFMSPSEKAVLDKLKEQLAWVPNIWRAEVHDAHSDKNMGNILLQGITPELKDKITQQLVSQNLAHESPSGELIYQFKDRQYKMNFSADFILR
jgi:hypothetical protein